MVSRNRRTCSQTRSWNLGRGCHTTGGANGDSIGSRAGSKIRRLPDILEVLPWLEADRPAGRDADFLAGPRIAADAALARLYLKDAESPKLDAFAALHGHSHRVEHRVDGYLGFDLGNVGDFRNFVDDVDLDHA